MSIRTYSVEITGTMPLLMHSDNVPWGDALKKWRDDPRHKKESVAGDDRSPAWSWLGSLYHDGKRVSMSSDNLMACIMEGAALVPTGRRQETFKSRSQSGLLVHEAFWPLIVKEKDIKMMVLKPLEGEKDFEVHEKTCKDNGFELFVKRARVGQAKHVRVRPMFTDWSCAGTIDVFDEGITKDVLASILEFAGRYKGLGDWRPGSPKRPGRYGTFTATVADIKKK